jgi:hypothetical protein
MKALSQRQQLWVQRSADEAVVRRKTMPQTVL